MIELPLFPLQTVLFPGMPLRLQIFEPRYRQLVQFCLKRRLPFGVVLIAEGVEAGGPLPRPYEIGCTARISYIEPAGNGRSNLLAIGGDRIRIFDIRREHPFLTARAEPMPFEDPPAQAGQAWADHIRPLLSRYLSLLNGLGLLQTDTVKQPSEPLALASFTCTVLQIPNLEKQALLASTSGKQLFRRLQHTLSLELALAERLQQRGTERIERSYSLN